MERRGNRSALCMKRGTQDPPNWNPHILRRWLSMTNTSTFRARRNEYECTHVGRCNRTAYTIYSVNVQSSFDRRIERFARFRTSSDYRINFERVFLYFLLYLFFPLFFNKNDDHPIDHAPDRGTFFYQKSLENHGSDRISDRGSDRVYRRLLAHRKTKTLHLLALQNLTQRCAVSI